MLASVAFALAAGCLLLTYRLIRSYFRLSNIPGPFWAKLTDYWRHRVQNSPDHCGKLVALHRQHGKLLRIGPNHVSISDPAAIPIVYSTSPPWQKGPSYYGAIPVSKKRAVPSIIAMDESQHTAVRKSVGRAFITNSLLDYEHAIEATCKELIEVLTKNPNTDIGLWLQFFAMDMITRIAFSETLGLLGKGGDIDGTLEAVVGRFDHWGHWGAMPEADFLLNKSRIATFLRGVGDSPLARVGMAKLQARMNDPNKAGYKDLCSKFLEGQAKHPDLVRQDEVLGIIMSTIGAGADTTAGTLTYTLYFLSKHPEVKSRIMDEITENFREGTLSTVPKWQDVNKMPYLEAVLMESMRLLPIPAWGLDRIVPDGGATIAGTFIPGGTVVGCQIDAIHLDEEVYGADSTTYRPERWLEASEDQRRMMNRSFLAFSTGKRRCTGLNIAWLEMKKTLPLLLMNFDVSPSRRGGSGGGWGSSTTSPRIYRPLKTFHL